MKRPLACILGWNNWIMDLSDFTEYQSNNRRNKCKSSSAGAGCWILNIIPPLVQHKRCVTSAHARLMRGCQMSRAWCWCPGNVWTSESEECLHAARGAGAGIIRLRLRSAPAVSRDPATKCSESRNQPGPCQSVNTEIIIHIHIFFLIFNWFAWNRKYSDCGFVPRKRQILRRSAEGWMYKRIWTSNVVYWRMEIFQLWRMKAMRRFNSSECIYLALAASIQFQQPILH